MATARRRAARIIRTTHRPLSSPQEEDIWKPSPWKHVLDVLLSLTLYRCKRILLHSHSLWKWDYGTGCFQLFSNLFKEDLLPHPLNHFILYYKRDQENALDCYCKGNILEMFCFVILNIVKGSNSFIWNIEILKKIQNICRCNLGEIN